MLGRATAALVGAASLTAVFGAGVASAAPGSVVSGFGQDGLVTQTFGASSPAMSFGEGMAVAANGDIYQSGIALSGSASAIYVARYLPNGTPDTSFGGNGVEYVPVSHLVTNPTSMIGAFLRSVDLALTPAGDPVVLANVSTGSGEQPVVLKLTQSGAPDSSFAYDGIYSANIGTSAPGTALAVQSDGAIVFTGAAYSGGVEEFYAERLTSSGALDHSFGASSSGIEELQLSQDATDQSSGGTGVIAQSGGNLVFSGFAWAKSGAEEFAAVRLSSSGQPDTTFGSGGVAYAQPSTIASPLSMAFGIAATPDGGYALAGTAAGDTVPYLAAVVRLNADGTPDTGFGTAGDYVLPSAVPSLASQVIAQPDGKLVLSGIAVATSNPDSLVVRINPQGGLDAGFGSGGEVLSAPASPTAPNVLIPVSAAETPDGNLVLSGFDVVPGPSPIISYLQELSLDTAPTLSFLYAPTTVQVGVPVQFLASATASADESISQISWDFGGGSFGAATGVTATHTFTSPGVYTVRVQATDAFGLSTVASQTITVTAAPVTTTPVTTTVTPAKVIKARPRLRVLWVKVAHGKIHVKLSCKAAACRVAADVTTLERLLSGRVKGLSAAGHGKHLRTVRLAGAHYRIGKNRTRTFTLKLDGIGHRLLKVFRRIPARASFKLTNTRPQRTIQRRIRIR